MLSLIYFEISISCNYLYDIFVNKIEIYTCLLLHVPWSLCLVSPMSFLLSCVIIFFFVMITTFNVNSWDGFSRYTFSQPLVDKKSFTYIGSGRNGLKTVR